MASFADDGCLMYRLLSAATTNGNNVKAAKGRVFGFSYTNTNAAVRYVKFYNKATAPTVGTDIPVLTYPIAASTNSPVHIPLPAMGAFFDTGIGIAITGALADNDTTAIGANETVLNLFYL